MPAIIRIGDPVECRDTMGQGSDDVFANNLSVSRVNKDKTVGHPDHGPTPVVSGSPNVFTNSISTDRVRDPIAPHGYSKMAAGSPDVFVNDAGEAASIVLDDYTAEFLVAANSIFKQPTVSAYVAAIHDTDDEGAQSDTGGANPTNPDGFVPLQSTDHVPHSNKQSYVAGAAKQEGVDLKTPQTRVDTANQTPATPAPVNSNYNYNDIDAATDFPGDFPVSPNFSLASLTTSCIVSHYPLRQQTTNGRVYSEKDIVKNLRDLCYNLLEPLKQMYPSMRVNSAFRHTANGRSQHERGQAADMSMSSTNSDSGAAWPVAQAIANSTLPYDQFIYEQNNTIWFHLSFDKWRGAQRRMLMSKSRSQPNPVAGLHQVQ